MDAYQKLIFSVKFLPCLWNEEAAFEYTEEAIRQIWNSVGEVQKPPVSGTTAFMRFKVLRDEFMSYDKLEESQSSSGQRGENHWKYYDDLLFLKDSINPKCNFGPAVKDENPHQDQRIELFNTTERNGELYAVDLEFPPVEFPYIANSKAKEAQEIIEIVSSEEEKRRKSSLNCIILSDTDSSTPGDSFARKRRKVMKKHKSSEQKVRKHQPRAKALKKKGLAQGHSEMEFLKAMQQITEVKDFISMIWDIMQNIPIDLKLQCLMDFFKMVQEYESKKE